MFGNVASSVGDMVQGNQSLEEVFARLGSRSGLVDAYLAAIMGILGLLAAAYAIQATLPLRSEEAGGRAEAVLATAVARLRWAGSHLVIALLGPAAALITAGLTTGLAYGLSTGDVGHQLPRVLAGAIVQLPAVWVLAAVAVALLACGRSSPPPPGRTRGLPAARLGRRRRPARPVAAGPVTVHRRPEFTGGVVAAAPLVVLAAVAVLFTIAGLVGLRWRDLPATS